MKAACVFLCLAAVLAFADAPYSPFAKSGVFLSGDYGVTLRSGSVTLNGSETGVVIPNFNSGAVSLGIIRGILPDLALRLALSMGSGREKGERLYNSVYDGSNYHAMRLSYAHSYTGFYPDLLYTLRPQGRLFPFLFAGTGISSYTVSRSAAIEDSTLYNGSSVKLPGENSFGSIAFNATAGLGCLWMYGANMGVLIQYKFRYWQPVSYDEELVEGMATTYSETHFSNQLEGGLFFHF